MNMKEVFDSVSESPRLRRFTTSCVLIYFIITLVFNLLTGYFPILSSFLGGHPFKMVMYLVEAALTYGIVKGIVTKNYRISDALGSFGDSAAYPLYATYAVLYIIFGIVQELVSKPVSGMATVGLVISIVFLLLRLFINFLMVRAYFGSILLNEKGVDFKNVWSDCLRILKNAPGRVVSIEAMKLIVNFVAVSLSVLLAGILPAHGAVSFALTCLITVQFGMLIYSWPVYYIYYKETFDL